MRTVWWSTAVLTMCVASAAFGGAKVEIDEEASIDIGFRVQALAIATEKDLDGDGAFDSDTDFKVRRGRLRLKGIVNEQVSAFLQTDVGSGADGSGLDWRLIDAFVTLQPCDQLSIIAGENMAPASRQNLTSSGALMCMDRPGMNYKTLTWGTRSVYAFANNTFADADAGLRGDVDVRDTGVTLFSSKSLTDTLHTKCYAGAYDGVQLRAEDNVRMTARAQVNLFDAEAGYYNQSTYVGGKKTVGLGASYDFQPDVASKADGGPADYSFWTVDAFMDLPLGPGHVTVEGAFQTLDLDDMVLDLDADPETELTGTEHAAGDGYYVQAGYLLDKVQPWIGFEQWDSDAETGRGSYDLYRAGLTYFLKGHNANLKAGYEKLESDTAIGATMEDSIESFVLGCYVTY